MKKFNSMEFQKVLDLKCQFLSLRILKQTNEFQNKAFTNSNRAEFLYGLLILHETNGRNYRSRTQNEHTLPRSVNKIALAFLYGNGSSPVHVLDQRIQSRSDRLFAAFNGFRYVNKLFQETINSSLGVYKQI